MLDPKHQDYPAPLKSGTTILEEEIVQAVDELRRPARGLFVSGLLAGISAAISIFLMAVVLSLAADLSPLALKLLLANAFAVGFIIVVLGHTDLFTEYTTMALLPVLTGRAEVTAVARLWFIVYAANQIAAGGFALLIVWLAPALDVAEPAAFGHLAAELVRHDWLTISVSALVAGWMMGLLSWLVSAARETISQIFFVWLITFAISLLGLHHCITGFAEVVAGAATGATAWGELGHFLVWATLGNTLGGILFALMVRYSIMVGQRRTQRDSSQR